MNTLFHKPKQYPFIKGKKGEDLLVDFWAILVFVVICLIMFLLFWATKKDSTNQVSDDFKNKDIALMLDAFLRSPYLKDGQETGLTIAEVIAQDSATKNFTRTERAFYYYFSGINRYTGRMQTEYYISRVIQSISITIKGSDVSEFRTINKDISQNYAPPSAITTTATIPRWTTPLNIQLRILYLDEKTK